MREVEPKLNQLFIKKDSGVANDIDHLFLDSAVYSRNRCFRLSYSSKAGKSAFLLPTCRFRCRNLVRFICFTKLCNIFVETVAIFSRRLKIHLYMPIVAIIWYDIGLWFMFLFFIFLGILLDYYWIGTSQVYIL